MKKAFVFNSCGYLFPQTNVMAEEAMLLAERGYEIVLARCGSALEGCFCNPEGRSVICSYCEACHWDIYRKMKGTFRHITVPRIIAIKPHAFDFRTIPELKEIVYRDVYIGYGVLSCYASQTREANFEFDCETIEYLRNRLDVACAYVDRVYEIFDEEDPDLVSIFNGRLIEQRVFFDIAKTRGIEVRVNEVVPEASGQTGFRKIVYENCLPHDIEANTLQVNELWEKSPLSEKARSEIGSRFFIRRAAGAKSTETDRVFTDFQQRGLLPEGVDPSGKNVVVFNSSEDEFVSVGREFDGHNLFLNQIDGIEAVCQALKETDYTLILRIHPNLTGVDSAFVTCLYDLPKRYGNVCVIPPESKVDSYALLQIAEKVVTFGSTMGIEAVYWGKPSVLLRASYYMNMGCCYLPRSIDEAVQILRSELKPKSKELAIKFGYWLMERHLTGEVLRFFPYTLVACKPRFVFGKFRTPNCLTTGGCTAIATLIARFLVKMSWMCSRRRINCPKKLVCTFRTMVKR